MACDTVGAIDLGCGVLGENHAHADRFDRPDTRHWPVVTGRVDRTVRRLIDRFAAAIESDEKILATVEDGARAQAIDDATKNEAETGTDQSVDVPNPVRPLFSLTRA